MFCNILGFSNLSLGFKNWALLLFVITILKLLFYFYFSFAVKVKVAQFVGDFNFVALSKLKCGFKFSVKKSQIDFKLFIKLKVGFKLLHSAFIGSYNFCICS
jgi:hypothetical protein